MESIKELAKEVIKKREISEGKKEDKKEGEIEPLKEYYVEPVTNPRSKEAIKIDKNREADGSFKVHTTQPMFIDCPYCGERRKPRGISGHVRERHGVPGVSMKELFDLKENEKSLEEFTCEKFGNEGDMEIKNIPTKILEREFPGWKKPGPEEEIPEEEKPEEGLEEEEIQEEDEILEDESPEDEILEDESPEDDEKNPAERRRFNLMPFFSPFDRRSRK